MDDPQSVAQPMTQGDAVEELMISAALACEERIGHVRTERMRDAVRAVLSAPPEVIAAAMGGRSFVDSHGHTVIVLPPRGDKP